MVGAAACESWDATDRRSDTRHVDWDSVGASEQCVESATPDETPTRRERGERECVCGVASTIDDVTTDEMHETDEHVGDSVNMLRPN